MKKKLWDACLAYVLGRISTARQAIASASDAAADDTKSSAGDKFETTREMMQQEIARHQQLLMDALQMEQILQNIDILGKADRIRPGSLVHTNRSTFFIAVSAGQLELEGVIYYAVSSVSPIGRLLLGKTTGDQITFNNLTYEIRAID